MIEGISCLPCRYWHPGTGTCRFSPPQVVSTIGGLQTAWPATEADDWCGEWVPDVEDDEPTPET